MCLVLIQSTNTKYIQSTWQYKVHSLFILSRLSTEIELSIQGLLIVIGKLMRNACIGRVKHDWKSVEWINRKHFLFEHDDIWNSKVTIYNKTTCLLRQASFNRDLSVVTPVKHFISMKFLASCIYKVFFLFLILRWLAKRIDLGLSSPTWIRKLLSTN